MAELKLDIIVLQTYNVKNLAVADASGYPDTYTPLVPSIRITPPGFNPVELPFEVNNYNVYTAADLIGAEPCSESPLPDGIYTYVYSNSPANENFVEKSFMRIDKIQEKYDSAFMSLDMMECDRQIKAQAKIDLNTIYFYIQGSVAAANNCAITQSEKLYKQADKMLNRFVNGGCGCSGTF